MEVLENLETRRTTVDKNLTKKIENSEKSNSLKPTERTNWNRNAIKKLPKYTIIRAKKIAKYNIAILVMVVLGILFYLFQYLYELPLVIVVSTLVSGSVIFYLTLDKILNSSKLFTLSNEGILLENGEKISWKNVNTYFSSSRKKEMLIVKQSDGIEKQIQIGKIKRAKEELGNLIELYKLKHKFLYKHNV